MTDQAQRLREIVDRFEQAGPAVATPSFFAEKQALIPRMVTMACCGGEDLFPYLVTNVGIGLAKYAPPLLILDATPDSRAMYRLLGDAPSRTLMDIRGGGPELADVLVEGPAGVNLIRVGSDYVNDFTSLSPDRLEAMIYPLSRLKRHFRLSLLVTGNGLSFPALNFLLASPEVVLFTTADEEAQKNCYLLVKLLNRKNPACRIGLVEYDEAEAAGGVHAARRIIGTARKFLHHEVGDYGVIEYDPALSSARDERRFRILDEPASRLGKSVDMIAERIYNKN